MLLEMLKDSLLETDTETNTYAKIWLAVFQSDTGNPGLSGDICIYTGIWRRTRSEGIKDR
jgi:hypothetical protein